MTKFMEGSNTSSEDKGELRRRLRAERLELPAEYAAESDAAIFEKLIALPEFKEARTVFTYLSVEGEPDTREIINAAIDLGKTVAIPRVKGASMDAVPVKSLDGLSIGKFGIFQPAGEWPGIDAGGIDFVVVPGLAFDRLGYRLGYGGGYYDRFLSKCHAYSVGLCRSAHAFEVLPRDEWDVPVDCVLTELGPFSKKRRGASGALGGKEG